LSAPLREKIKHVLRGARLAKARKLLLAKGLDKLTGIVDDACHGMERRYIPKALLEIHHDQCSLRVKDGEWHEILLESSE
jgi:hypothetical protein